MSRAERLLPDGWKPSRGARVTVLPSKDSPAPPLGVWRIIERGPLPNTWWLMPSDDRARTWATKWPRRMTQGCYEAPGRLLEPAGTVRV